MSKPGSAQSRVLALIEEATRPVPLLWPLGSAVAANPLWDLRYMAFPDALARAGQALGLAGLPAADLLADAFRAGRVTVADLERALDDHGHTGASRRREDERWPGEERAATILERHDAMTGGAEAAAVDREVSKHCAAYLAGLQSTGKGAGSGFFAGWRSAVGHDPVGRRLRLGELTRGLADYPEEVIASIVDRLGLDERQAVAELTGQAARLPGWAAHAKWRSRWAAPDHPGPALHLVDYLAVRLSYDLAALAHLGHRPGRGQCCDLTVPAVSRPPGVPAAGLVGGRTGQRLAQLDASRAGLTWLAAYEGHYRDQLLSALDRTGADATGTAPAAQVVCCIDARSEGLRRHLEALGGYETFGFAGFFGIPARVWPLASQEPLDLCPVLVRPTVELTEAVADPDDHHRRVDGARRLAAARQVMESTRKASAAPFLLAEAGGFGLGPLAVLRTAAPASFDRLRRWFTDRLVPRGQVGAVLEGPGAPSDADQALYAETALRTMGLTKDFAPVVVLCGHGSTTENNPYASALDCGACGAARGGRSARLAAAVYNRPAVRARLAERGIMIPERTLFVAAEHDTATDSVTLFPPDDPAVAVRGELARLGADLNRAGAALAQERMRSLPGTPRRRPQRHPRHLVAARAADWAQVQPEWGLARCAAFIAGPRRFTAGIDLQRRVFLHSYEPEGDADGAALETILTGPMVVAQWISAAYYHSTVDPEVLGAGDKVAHNVVAGVGVYQGAGGDLKLGLPRQAVFDRHGPYHEPMRLLVVVAAPRARVDGVIDRHGDLVDLVDGGWVNLVASYDDRFWLRRPGGRWQAWIPPGR